MANYKKPADRASETITFRTTQKNKRLLHYLAEFEETTVTGLIIDLVQKYADELGVDEVPKPKKKKRPGRPRMYKEPRQQPKPVAAASAPSIVSGQGAASVQGAASAQNAVSAQDAVSVQDAAFAQGTVSDSIVAALSAESKTPLQTTTDAHLELNGKPVGQNVSDQGFQTTEPYVEIKSSGESNNVASMESAAVVGREDIASNAPRESSTGARQSFYNAQSSDSANAGSQTPDVKSTSIEDAILTQGLQSTSPSSIATAQDIKLEQSKGAGANALRSSSPLAQSLKKTGSSVDTFGGLAIRFRKYFKSRAEGTRREADETIAFLVDNSEGPALIDESLPLSELTPEYLQEIRENIKQMKLRFAKKNLHLTYLRMILHWAIKQADIDLHVNPAIQLSAFTITEISDAWPRYSEPPPPR